MCGLCGAGQPGGDRIQGSAGLVEVISGGESRGIAVSRPGGGELVEHLPHRRRHLAQLADHRVGGG